MPKYKVKVLKRVRYAAVVEIEADNELEAEERAMERAASQHAPDWEHGETEDLWSGPAQATDDRIISDRLSAADTYWSDRDLFRRLGLRPFRQVAGKRKVGTLEMDGHKVDIQVHCLPAQFWKFHITGPLFCGRVCTGSGPLVDFWWAVEALIRGTVQITCPEDIQREGVDCAYSVAGSLPDERMRSLRHLLALGMLVVEPRR
jgi:hypothetical protein